MQPHTEDIVIIDAKMKKTAEINGRIVGTVGRMIAGVTGDARNMCKVWSIWRTELYASVLSTFTSSVRPVWSCSGT